MSAWALHAAPYGPQGLEVCVIDPGLVVAAALRQLPSPGIELHVSQLYDGVWPCLFPLTLPYIGDAVCVLRPSGRGAGLVVCVWAAVWV
jgi:hypothetical protein